MKLQASGEMYLETIYVLSKEMSAVRSIDVGEYMGFSKPSVSRAVGLLKENGYITVDDGGHLHLAASGRAPHSPLRSADAHRGGSQSSR